MKNKNLITLFHGVSDSQRGDTAESKLKNILETKELFPVRIDQPHRKLKREIINHADKTLRRYPYEMNFEEYISKYGDNELKNKKIVKDYLEDEKMRQRYNKFKVDIISSDQFERIYTNWFSPSEEEVRSRYGDKVYIEFNVPKEQIVGEIDPKKVKTHTPLPLIHATRMVISNDLDSKEIEGLLKKSGLDHIKIETT